jgi:hypothetical protein
MVRPSNAVHLSGVHMFSSPEYFASLASGL